MPYAVMQYIATVVLDAGHGGRDPGACYAGRKESEMALRLTLSVGRHLEKCGFRVIYTRTEDVALGSDVNADLQARCDIANAAAKQFGKVIMLSLHLNAGRGDGDEILAHPADGETVELSRMIVRNVGVIVGFHGEPFKDGSDLYIVRNTDDLVKARLLEVGFIDGLDDYDQIVRNYDRIVDGIVRAFCEFYRVPMKEEAQNMANDQQVPAWFAESWNKAIKVGVIKGDENGNFNPNDPVTRAMMVQILDNAGLIKEVK